MDHQFEKIMLITGEKNGKQYHPFSINHVREVCYGRCWNVDSVFHQYEINIHVVGTTTLCIADQTYYPRRGTVATFKPDELHKQFVTGLEAYERYILWFDYEYVRDLFDGADESLLAMFSQRENYENNVLQLTPYQTEHLLSIVEKAADYSLSDAPEAPGLFLSACLKALSLISKWYATTISKQGMGNYSPIVSMALEIIEKQFSELQCVEQLASQLHISNSYLARIFKKQVGTSVYEYIQNMKLAGAVQMLAAGKSVTEACFDSGFNNYSYFIQLFKRKYGITPHKYQKSLDF